MTDCMVQLEPHVGKRRHGNGFLPVDFGQKKVYLNGLHVGYISDHDGAPLNLIVPLDDATRERVRAEVERLRGEKAVGRVNQVPAIEEEPEPETAEYELV